MTVLPNTQQGADLFFKHLIKCPPDRAQELLHHLFDVFCGQKSSYACYSDVYSLVEWWDLISSTNRYLKEIYNQVSVANPKLDQVPTEYQEILKDVFEVRSTDLKESLIEKSHAVSSSYVKSFDWKVKLTLASDKMSQMNEPRLLLDLDVTGDKLLQLDLNKDELKAMIDTMEKAKQAVVDMMAD